MTVPDGVSESPPGHATADRIRRRRRLIAAGLCIVAAASAAAVLLAAGAFDVDRIRFSGLHRVSLDEAERAAGIRVGDFMGTVDVDRAERSLEGLPWVSGARVRRHWRGTVDVEVVERSPSALALAAAESWVLVDIEGRVLTSALTVLPDLPRLSGIGAAPSRGGFLADDASALLDVLSAASGQPEFAVVALWRDGRGDMRARVRQGPGDPLLEVVLGDESAIRAKTAAIAAVIGEVAHGEALLDVSVPRLPVLRAHS